MNVDELIYETCGKDEDGVPKSAITLALSMWHIGGEDTDDVSVNSFHNPTVNIERRGNYIQTDLAFDASADPELRMLWNGLEEYGKLANEVNEHSTEVPFCSLTIVPIALDGMFYTMAINPIFWSLHSSIVGGKADTIRILFEAGDFMFYETEGMDIATAKAEAEREVEKREYILMMEEIKAAKAEREAAERESAERERELRRQEYENDISNQRKKSIYGYDERHKEEDEKRKRRSIYGFDEKYQDKDDEYYDEYNEDNF